MIRVPRPTLIHVVVLLEVAAAFGNVIVGNWERGLLFALTAFVLLLVDDGVKLRRRLDELEKTVREIIEN